MRKFVHEVGARGLEQQLRGAQEEVRRLRGEMVGGTSKREAFCNTLRRHLNFHSSSNLVSKARDFLCKPRIPQKIYHLPQTFEARLLCTE